MKRLTVVHLLYGITLAAAFGSAMAGCRSESVPPETASQTATADDGRAGEDATNDDAALRQDLWDALLIQGAHVGYSHTLVRPIDRDGRELLRITSTSKLSLKRFGQTAEQSIEMESIETRDGQLVEFKTTTALGPTPMVTTGTVTSQGQLEITITAGKKSATSAIPWSPTYRGMFGAERELSVRPMQEGETREFQMLVPILNQLATIKLIARGKESTPLLDGNQATLMRIDSITTLADGNELATAIWVDDQGKTLKTRSEAMQQETYRTTEELAKSEQTATRAFDLGFDTMVPMEAPSTPLHAAKLARYRVTLAEGDPAKAFVSSPQQAVKSTGANAAELAVQAIRPDTPRMDGADADRAAPEDSAPNALIQSDDPQVVALAQSVAANSNDPWTIAVALEKLVHDAVNEKNFTQAFASAAEVAKSREGDCSEHAVLLAALLRARGIPARVAAGLVYVEVAHAFGYHMWTEAYIADRWIPLDATLAKGGIGAGHLKLFTSSLNGASAYSSFLPVAQVLGRLKIELLSVE